MDIVKPPCHVVHTYISYLYCMHLYIPHHRHSGTSMSCTCISPTMYIVKPLCHVIHIYISYLYLMHLYSPPIWHILSYPYTMDIVVPLYHALAYPTHNRDSCIFVPCAYISLTMKNAALSHVSRSYLYPYHNDSGNYVACICIFSPWRLSLSMSFG